MSETDRATGLPTTEWNVGTDDNGFIRAVWKKEDAYVIVADGDGSWSLTEAGQSLGSFPSAVEAASAMPVLESNPWDDIDGYGTHLYLRLAPKTFHEWVSGESDDVYLRRELGSWWLSVPDQQGQSEYPTRLRGMIAGLEHQDASYENSNELVIASLGLDENDWKVEIGSGFISATYLHDEDISLQADDGSMSWSVFNGEELVSNHPDLKEAVAAATPARNMTV